MRGTYTRWTRARDGVLSADILSDVEIDALSELGKVRALLPVDRLMTPDEARLIGVRLIEAAALADGERAIRS